MDAQHLLVPGRAWHLPGGWLHRIVTRRRDEATESFERRIRPVAGRPAAFVGAVRDARQRVRVVSLTALTIIHRGSGSPRPAPRGRRPRAARWVVRHLRSVAASPTGRMSASATLASAGPRQVKGPAGQGAAR